MEDMKLKMIKDILYSNSKYKNMKIGYRQEDDCYLIYHYQENFDIFDVDFHKLMSKIIKEVFYKNGIKNVAQRDLFKRELEEYFPEEHKKENEIFEITLLYEKDHVLSQIFQKITRLLDNYNKVSEYSNKIKDTTVFYNKIKAKNKKRTTSLKIDFKRARNLKFREIPHPSIIESELLNVEYVK